MCMHLPFQYAKCLKKEKDGVKLNELSDKIRLLRKSQRLSQTELAERVGITQEFMSEIERGKKKPSIQVLEKLCDALECSADFLLGLEVPNDVNVLEEQRIRGGLSSEMLDEMMQSGVSDSEMRLALKLAKVMHNEKDN